MVTTYLTQFPAGTFQTSMKPFVSEPRRLSEALEAIANRPGVVMHAVVLPELKHKIQSRCHELNIACLDLTGQAVEFLSKAASAESLADRDRLHRVDHVYCDRINAMSFTLEHDDGLGLDSIGEADIVLAGVSRTGKTPTSVYLAMLGFRVANVSLAVEAPVPPTLLNLAPGKTVGLIIDPFQLAQIRNRRRASWRMGQTSYSDPIAIEQEINWCRRLFATLRCPVLDVTDQAIEETAARVLDLLGITEPPRRAASDLM
jgi:regulator of PEP synthase PpsR (kinase-PPPase family)